MCEKIALFSHKKRAITHFQNVRLPNPAEVHKYVSLKLPPFSQRWSEWPETSETGSRHPGPGLQHSNSWSMTLLLPQRWCKVCSAWKTAFPPTKAAVMNKKRDEKSLVFNVFSWAISYCNK